MARHSNNNKIKQVLPVTTMIQLLPNRCHTKLSKLISLKRIPLMMISSKSTLSLFVVLHCLPSLVAFAQVPGGGSGSVAHSLGEELQQNQGQGSSSPNSSNAQFRLPRLNLPPPNGKQLSVNLKFYCKAVQLSGNSVFSSEALGKITQAFTNREINNQELQQLRQDLTRFYVDRGYINSGAVIPDQDLADGVLRISIIEGRLERIDVEGTENYRPSVIQERIALEAEQPLQVNRLQQNLQMLLENPLIDRVNAQLLPGSQPGTAILKTLLREKSPYQLGTIFDNQIAPSVGGYQGTSYAGYRNLTGLGDAFTAQGRFAPGLTGLGADYWLPFNRYDSSLHGWYSHYNSNLVETPYNEIDISSSSEAYGMSLNQPIIHTPEVKLSGSLTMEHRYSQTYLLGQPFSFSPGVQTGRSSVTVLRIGQEWLQHTPEQVFAARSVFNVGINALDATINSNTPDGRFFKWLGQLQWGRHFGDAQLIWRGDIQLTKDGLLPLEKFQIGGFNSVRGYRENQLVKDWGFATSLEFRYPILTEVLKQNSLFIAPFADLGGGWNNTGGNISTQGTSNILASSGFGFIWEPKRQIHFHAYWGKQLIQVYNSHQDPQDYGFHFKLALQFI